MNEKDIIKKIKNGNKEAFRLLIEQYKTMVFSTSMGFVHHREDAEDITQEVFIKVYSSLDTFREESRFSTWLYRITVNTSLNYKRSKKMQYAFLHPNSDNPDRDPVNIIKDDEKNEPDYSIQENQKRKILKTVLNSLPEQQRMAFVLNKYEDLGYKEIAEIMDNTLSSVESLIFRAKRNIIKKLDHLYKKTLI